MRTIPEKEDLFTEFKSDTKKKNGLPDSELIEAVVGMANAEGGILYVGVEDYAKPFVQTLFSKNNELSSHRFCLQSVCYQTCFVNFIRSFVVQPLMNPFTIEELYKLPETFSQFLCT